MKKVLIVVFALLLALPAVSFAGSATSRWDLTIGGYVKVDVGYSTQAPNGPAGLEEYFPDRPNNGANQNAANKSGSFAMATGQTALNFLIKGPDTWGAKTTAFIQGNFAGQTINGNANANNGSSGSQFGNVSGTGTRYGTFTLSHAYMDFTWATTKLTVGQQWQAWGFQPSYTFLGLYDLLMAGRGNTVPQITVTQNFNKEFYGSFGIQEPYNMRDQYGGSANLGLAQNTILIPGGSTPMSIGTLNPTTGTATSARVTTVMPDFVAELGYKSEACGRIGPNVMQFAVGGFWGQDTMIYIDPSAAVKSQYSTSHVDRWGAAFKAFIPIIPEKNLNKAGAFSVSGSVFTGQNLANWFLGARGVVSPVPYDANPGAGVRYTVPVTTGGWGQLSYYFTDKVYVNGLYGWNHNYTSELYNWEFPNQIHNWSQIIGNVIYDVNPAVRFGVEYVYSTSGYNYYGGSYAGQLVGYGTGAGGGQPGSANMAAYPLGTQAAVSTARLCFWYFF